MAVLTRTPSATRERNGAVAGRPGAVLVRLVRDAERAGGGRERVRERDRRHPPDRHRAVGAVQR